MKKELFSKIKKEGFSLVEVLLSISLFIFLSLGLISGLTFAVQSNYIIGNKSKALYLLDEGMEAVRAIRDEDFNKLEDGIYGLDSSGTSWELVSSVDAIDGFSRLILISTVDESTKRIDITVSWDAGFSLINEVSASKYLTNWRQFVSPNNEWVLPTVLSNLDIPGNSPTISQDQTLSIVAVGTTTNLHSIDTQDLFNLSILDTENVQSDLTDVLIAGDKIFTSGTSNSQEIQIFNLDSANGQITFNNSIDLIRNADLNAITADDTNVFFARSSFDELVVVDNTNSLPSLISSLDIRNSGNDLVTNGEYIYFGTNSNNSEIVVIDKINSIEPIVVENVNLGGNADVTHLDIINNDLVVGRSGGFLEIYDVSNPIEPNLLGSTSVGGEISDISVDQNSSYVFISSSDTAGEFKTFDVSEPSAISVIGSLDTSFSIKNILFDANQNVVYALTDNSSGEFIVISPI